jgi:predicted secreted protein
MKGKAFLVLLLLLLAVFMVSCAPPFQVIHVEISSDTFSKNPTDLRDDFETYVGDKIYVELSSNPSTGFEWVYKMSGDTAVKEQNHGYQAPSSDVPGTPGKQTWIFEAVSEGNTEILMTYSQPWDGGIKEKWIYRISVAVRPSVLPTP